MAPFEVALVHVCDLSSHNGFELYAGPATDIASEQQRIAELQRRAGSESSVRVASGPMREALLDQVR